MGSLVCVRESFRLTLLFTLSPPVEQIVFIRPQIVYMRLRYPSTNESASFTPSLLSSNQSSSASPKFIIFNNPRTDFPVNSAEASNTYISSSFINYNPLHSEIHPMPTLATLSSLPFGVADIMAVIKCSKPSHMPGPDGNKPVPFRWSPSAPFKSVLTLPFLRCLPVTIEDIPHCSTSRNGFYAWHTFSLSTTL